MHHAVYTKSINSFSPHAPRSLLTPSSVRPVSLSILRNISAEYQRLLTFRYKIAIFQHSRTVANISKVAAVMWMFNETLQI